MGVSKDVWCELHVNLHNRYKRELKLWSAMYTLVMIASATGSLQRLAQCKQESTESYGERNLNYHRNWLLSTARC